MRTRYAPRTALRDTSDRFPPLGAIHLPVSIPRQVGGLDTPSLTPWFTEYRQQIQPWHPSSTLVHEAGVAVLQTQPDKFWEFSKALFDKQGDYFDVNVVNEPRNKTSVHRDPIFWPTAMLTE